MPTPPQIQKLLTEKLASSGIKPDKAKPFKYTIERPSILKKLGLPEGYAIKIPYFLPTGETTEFCRYRYLEDIRTEQEISQGRKLLRYVQPPGSLNEIYLPPVLDWRDIALNPTIKIIITEGEFKAACAAVNGIACVGLGGVWCFKSTANNMAVIPAMNWLLWKDREVIVMFDSDVVDKPDVRNAETELCMILTELGAKPRIARLPTLEGQSKTGLDDFIISQGSDALEEIISKAEDFVGSALLYELNKEVVYVRNPGLIVKLDNNQRMMPRAFVDHAYANRTYTETVFNSDGGTRMVTKSAPKEWLKWGQRSEVERVVYAPGQPRVHHNNLNVWPGWSVEPKQGNIKPWNDLLDYLFEGEPEARLWFEQWLAYPIQYPGTKLYTTVVLWGINQGTGKSLVAYTMKQIYGKNFTEIEEENLSASHNEWSENKQFILGDDVTGKEHRAYADKLKGMISRQILRINPKYIPSYEVQDCINYYFTSNQPDAFFLEDKDRRFFIHEINRLPLTQEFYNEYDKWYRSEEGASALFAHLLSVDTSKFNPKAPALVTASKLAMIEDVKSDVARWAATLKRDPNSILKKNGEVLPYDLWRTEDLLKAYDPLCTTRVSINGMARELKRAGIDRAAGGRIINTSAGQTTLWIVRNPNNYIYEPPVSVGKSYDAEREGTKDKIIKVTKPVGFDRKRKKA